MFIQLASLNPFSNPSNKHHRQNILLTSFMKFFWKTFTPQHTNYARTPPPPPLSWWVSPKCVNEESSTERRITTVRSTELLNCNVKTWVNTGSTRLERPPPVEEPLSVYCSSPIFALVLRLVRRKVIHASRFYYWFWESFKELSFTSRGFTRFNWHSFTLSITSHTCTLELHFCSLGRSLYGERK